MSKARWLGACLAGLALAGAGVAGEKPAVKVLIVDGHNNHDWRATTPVPRSRDGTRAATDPSSPKASGPTTSAVQNERYPRSAAFWATTTASEGATAPWSEAKVTPSGREASITRRTLFG